ncbi:hypothetical protein CK934_14650 [Chitinophaga sp. MD30]|nr:hypothetical protein CK934_14650 [Chitinophaga sp. MD30]
MWCKAQQINGTPPPPAPGNELAGTLSHRPPGRPAPLAQLTTVSGTIVEYIANDRHEFDAFRLQTGGKNLIVKFPPHLGAQLMKMAGKGNTVTVEGTLDTKPDVDSDVFSFYSLKSGGNLIIDTPAPLMQPPGSEQLINFSGKISDLNHNHRGMISGIVLNGKMVVSLPPPAVEQLAQYLKINTELAGTGIKRPVPAGVVVENNMGLLDARTLSIGGQTYLVR